MAAPLIRIATRQSKLALWQANFVRDELLRLHPQLKVELVGMTTKGDRWLQAPLSEIGGKGLFIKELEAAMLAGQADIAVHSVKDLPAELPEGFALPIVAYREDVRDVLVSPAGDLAALPKGARVGSSSLRRQAQLLAQRPDLELKPIRGNVGSRLDKLASGEYDAIVLAAAGLNRLQLDVPRYPLAIDLCLPAPGQAALGIECRVDLDAELRALLEPLQDPDTERCVRAERGISLGLGADCSLPVAALATLEQDGRLDLQARIARADGSQILHTRQRGDEPQQVAQTAVEALFAQGAADILASLRTE